MASRLLALEAAGGPFPWPFCVCCNFSVGSLGPSVCTQGDFPSPIFCMKHVLWAQSDCPAEAQSGGVEGNLLPNVEGSSMCAFSFRLPDRTNMTLNMVSTHRKCIVVPTNVAV